MDMQGSQKNEDKDEEIQNIKDFEEQVFDLNIDLKDESIPKDG